MKFKEYSFKDLLVDIVDNRGKTCPTAETGIPLIATNCIKNDALYPVFEKVRYVDDENYDNWFRGHPEPGDMIFVCKGSPGRVAWVPDPINFCIAQDMVAIRADTTKVYPKYLFALLRSEQTQQKIMNMHVGTLIPHFKKGDFGNLYFDIPEDLEYQKQVGDAYFSFCEKIEHNHQINQTLEQIAQAIFKSWFVDFEPVKAKIEAKKEWEARRPTAMDGGSDENAGAIFVECGAMRAICGAVQGNTSAAGAGSAGAAKTDKLDQLNPKQRQQLTTAALFPDELVVSELDEIPKGWGVRRIDEILELAYGKALKKTDRNPGNVPVYGSGGVTGFHDIHLVEGPGIIVGRKGTVGSLYWEDRNFFPIDTVFYVAPKKGFSLEYIYYLLQTLGLEDMNTDAAIPGLNRNNVYRLAVAGHPLELVEMYSKVVKSFTDKISVNKNEASSLTEIRDSLLPKLLSGEIEIEAA